MAIPSECSAHSPLPAAMPASAAAADLQRRIPHLLPRPDGRPHDVQLSRFDAGTYRVEGTVTSAGLAALFDDTRARCRPAVALPQAPPRPPPSGRLHRRQEVAAHRPFAFQDGDGRPAPSTSRRSRSAAATGCRFSPAHLTSVTDPMSRDADRGRQSGGGLRAHRAHLRRRDARRSDADATTRKASSTSPATTAEASPAGCASSRSPAIERAESRWNS